MATTNPASLTLSPNDSSPIQAYKGTRKRKLPEASYWSGLNNFEVDEDFYQDVTGKPITNFDPKTHSVVGGIDSNGVRTKYGNEAMPSWMPKFGPQYSGPMARPQPYSGPMAKPTGNRTSASLTDAVRKTFPNATTAPQSAPDAVRASAQATTAPTDAQKTIAQRQADDIRASGRLTANDQSAQIAASIKDPNSAFNAAMARGGHADAHARNMRVGKYAHFDPDAFIPETVGVKGKGAVTYRERAYGKHFATPEPTGTTGGWFPEETPFIRKGGDWVGNNILTGEFKDPEGNIWGNEGQFRNSQRGEAGMVETDGRPDWMGPEFSWESKDYDPIADSVRMGGGLPKDPEIGPLQNREPTTGPSKREFTDARLGEFLRARMKGYQAGDHSLDSLTSGQYHDPSFLHFTKGNTAQGRWGDVDPSVGSIYYGNEQDPLFERAASGLTLNPMPETSIEDAVSQRNAFNPFTPKRDFDPISAIRNFGAPPQSREITGRKMNIKRPIR
jgi:hypothetical protein